MKNKIYPGQTIVVRGTFRNTEEGGFVDPDNVIVIFKKPDGTEEQVTTERESQGKYSGKHVVYIPGDWYWRMVSDGDAAAAKEGSFRVEASRFN